MTTRDTRERVLAMLLILVFLCISTAWSLWHVRQHTKSCPPDAQCWMLYEGCQAERAALRSEARR